MLRGVCTDTRLVDLAVGEKNVYKRRGLKDQARITQRLPKRLSFIVDVSASMAHFNRCDLSATLYVVMILQRLR